MRRPSPSGDSCTITAGSDPCPPATRSLHDDDPSDAAHLPDPHGVLPLIALQARAQGLYDEGTLRYFMLTFPDQDWVTKLKATYQTENYYKGDLTVGGKVYRGVGVRIRSFSAVIIPAGSKKWPLRISMDAFTKDQRLLGHKTLKLDNTVDLFGGSANSLREERFFPMSFAQGPVVVHAVPWARRVRSPSRATRAATNPSMSPWSQSGRRATVTTVPLGSDLPRGLPEQEDRDDSA